MIDNNTKLIIYLNNLVNSIFKILPLYEEKNEGIEIYIDSLLFELYGLDYAVSVKHGYEYIALLSTLESTKRTVSKGDNKKTIKREVFKSINIVKNLIGKLEEDE
ncbi:hypothetical protein NSQ93_22775 [Bacillus sp. FSL W8-0445]|uniref:hypothetical protein n=1 Tax=Bacillota TaxID=1239 RepID=UPI00092C0449|nr:MULTISPECIES: hypothetical protein [Bacillota]HZH62998.1 hypothetical protein [Metabacillus sp.]NFT30733.1 hypothetical protein [Clostridium sporogenes]OJT57292.1 hypothetical protein BFP47_11290 [Bacillus licheniformis]OJT70066.1 hypothetical protein BFP46_05600 [Bacillus licheniformis]TWM14698.1 hypothetical protein CHCC15091_1739 [Bacillus licheniformis]